MYSSRAAIAIFLLVAAAFAASGYFYGGLPDTVASHWNAAGEPDGHMSKKWGAFALPSVLLILWLAFTFLPRYVPESLLPRPSGRIAGFVLVLFLFLGSIHVQVVLWNVGRRIPFEVTVPIGLAVLFFYLGIMLGSVEPNWVVGIRTYWTLKSPVVWRQTHQRAGVLFKIIGFIYLAAAFFRGYLLLFILLPALFVALYLVGYSFILYQKVHGGEGDGPPIRRDRR
jgi:uncharacterized membrane protein